MSGLLWGALLFLLVNALACLTRTILGPTLPDRIIAANVIGTKTVVVLVLLGVILDQVIWMDVALIYALLSFTFSLAVGRLIETGRLRSLEKESS